MKEEYLNILRVGVAEVLGTGLLLFLGCMSCVEIGGFKPSHLTICIGFGLAVMLIVNIFGMISGAHLNPAVTLAAYVYKLVDMPTAFAYVIGQFTGALLGYSLLRLLTPPDIVGENFCVNIPNVDPLRAFGVEFVITMCLIALCCGVWDPRNAKHHDSVPLRFGLAISMLALVGGPYSGGSMNPARSFAPAIYNLKFEHHWIYWVAPMTSALVTSVVFKKFFYVEVKEISTKGEQLPLKDRNNA